MSKFFNLKSKKGFSLAYALVVCMFLMLIVGGITTTAIMQNNETSSDMGTRQAYISAKSGLNSVQTAFKSKIIDSEELSVKLPNIGDGVYCVLWQDESGNVHIEYCANEESAWKFLKDHPEYDIIGGEGTYYRITFAKVESGVRHYNVTALNSSSGKFNAIAPSKGDLSINIVVVSEPVEEEPTEFGTIYGGGGGDGDSGHDSGGGNVGLGANVPIMVGQQTAINELRASSDNDCTANKMLNNITKETDQIFYIGDTQNNIATSRSVFPIVYDRIVKITTSSNKAGIASYNQGVYFLGDYSGPRVEVWDESNNSMWQQIGRVSYYTEDTYNQLSINSAFVVIENNVISFAYDQYRGNNVILHYYGDKGQKHNYYGGSYWVYVYLPKGITVYSTDQSKHIVRDNRYTFTLGSGWYMIKSGNSIDNIDNWKPLDESLLVGAENMCQYNQIMSYYNDGGTIHTGTNETEWSSFDDDRVQILNNVGQYNTDSSYNTGYSPSNGPDTSTSFFDISNNVQDRSKMNIFFSANMSPIQTGYYNWYAGRTFSFTWCHTKDFEVNNNTNVSIIGSNIIMNVGVGDSDGDDKGEASRKGWYEISYTDIDTEHGRYGIDDNGVRIATSISKVIKRPKGSNGTFKLFGTQDNGSSMTYGTQKYSVSVPNSFKVVYYDGDVEKSYTIKGGVSTNGGYKTVTYTMNESVDLFSDRAKQLFETMGNQITYVESDIYTGSDSSSTWETAWEVSVGPPAPTFLDLDQDRGFIVAESLGTIEVNENSTFTIGNDLRDCDQINISDDVTELYFANTTLQDSSYDRAQNFKNNTDNTPRKVLRLEVKHKFTINRSGQKIIFKPGLHEILLESGEETKVNMCRFFGTGSGGTAVFKNGKDGSPREYY